VLLCYAPVKHKTAHNDALTCCVVYNCLLRNVSMPTYHSCCWFIACDGILFIFTKIPPAGFQLWQCKADMMYAPRTINCLHLLPWAMEPRVIGGTCSPNLYTQFFSADFYKLFHLFLGSINCYSKLCRGSHHPLFEN